MRRSFLIISTFFFIQCNSSSTLPPPPPKPEPGIYSLIFIDKTVSIQSDDPYIQEKYESVLNKIISENVRQKGDKVEVYFIHENTSQGRVFSIQSKTQIGDTTALNQTDILAVKNTYFLALKKEKNKILQRCKEALASLNKTDTRKSTDIWATLEIIDKKNAKKAAESILKVYYFSDMVESMPGYGNKRRDFHVAPPFSNEHAIQMATEDAQKFNDLDIEGIEVYYILPFSPLSSTSQNNPLVIKYWEKMFDTFGIDELIELNGE